MRKSAAALSALTAFALFPPSADASPNISGNELYDACITDDMAQQGFCLGYVIGLVEGIKWGASLPMMINGNSTSEVDRLSNTLLRMCLPTEGATFGQYRDVVVNYLGDNAQDRHGSARVMAHTALMVAFPCQ